MDLNSPPPSSSGFSNFPILAIVLLAITVTGFLLVSYYIFVIKCCLNWQHLHPLRSDRGPRVAESWLAFSSPATDLHRGLDELVLRDIPTFKYRAKGSTSFGSTTSSSSSKGERSFRGCAVCLSAFEDQEMLRVLPHCGHLFHLDCIDVWLLNNANCPLCRSSISGAAKRGPLDHIVAPSSSPQEIIPTATGPDPLGSDGFVVVEMAANSGETNNNNKDELFDVGHPIRRSFSMDSAIDGRLLLQVQQIIRHNRRLSNEAAASSSASNRSIRRSFFSFGQGQGSKSAVLPIQSDL